MPADSNFKHIFDKKKAALAFCRIMSRCFKVEAMLSTADKNKDNTINYCEFRVRLTYQHNEKRNVVPFKKLRSMPCVLITPKRGL